MERVRLAMLGVTVTVKVTIVNDYSLQPNATRGTVDGVNRDIAGEQSRDAYAGSLP